MINKIFIVNFVNNIVFCICNIFYYNIWTFDLYVYRGFARTTLLDNNNIFFYFYVYSYLHMNLSQKSFTKNSIKLFAFYYKGKIPYYSDNIIYVFLIISKLIIEKSKKLSRCLLSRCLL